MKRNRLRRFFQQKQYAIASLVLFVAIAGMTGVYLSDRITNRKEETELAQEEEEPEERQRPDYVSLSDNNDMDVSEHDAESVNSVIQPQGTTPAERESVPVQEATVPSGGQNLTPESPSQAAVTEENTTTQTNAPAKLNFKPETDLGWPLQGDVILNFSMDQTVYFATLEQYKYNPALIISGKVNDPVQAAATGKITDISVNEETGVTVTMNLGNGYSAVYGQLKEVLYKEGATVEAGNAIGYVAEPTKYYSVEGSNLYFKLLKDDKPVNPMKYIR